MKRMHWFVVVILIIAFQNCSDQTSVVDVELQTNRELSGVGDYENLLNEYDSEVILANFFSAGCQACRYEVPVLNKIYAEYDDEITLLALNVDPVNTIAQARDFAVNLGLEFDVYLDMDRKIFSTLELRFFPTNIFYARDKSKEPVVINGALEYSQGKVILDGLLRD